MNLDGWDDIVTATGSGYVSVQLNRLGELGLVLPTLSLVRSRDAIEFDWPAAFPDYRLTESSSLKL
ncbi:MAG: hypothetical protein KDN22_27125 [Verrucomicrobiae bacterium]|nr:hypothetical protein [Verrucomicrobiae bacterium]